MVLAPFYLLIELPLSIVCGAVLLVLLIIPYYIVMVIFFVRLVVQWCMKGRYGTTNKSLTENTLYDQYKDERIHDRYNRKDRQRFLETFDESYYEEDFD